MDATVRPDKADSFTLRIPEPYEDDFWEAVDLVRRDPEDAPVVAVANILITMAEEVIADRLHRELEAGGQLDQLWPTIEELNWALDMRDAAGRLTHLEFDGRRLLERVERHLLDRAAVAQEDDRRRVYTVPRDRARWIAERVRKQWECCDSLNGRWVGARTDQRMIYIDVAATDHVDVEIWNSETAYQNRLDELAGLTEVPTVVGTLTEEA